MQREAGFFLLHLGRRQALAHEIIMILFQICLQGFQIVMIVRQVSSLLLGQGLVPQPFLMACLIVCNSFKNASVSFR
jgi:hypothetical protein